MVRGDLDELQCGPEARGPDREPPVRTAEAVNGETRMNLEEIQKSLTEFSCEGYEIELFAELS